MREARRRAFQNLRALDEGGQLALRGVDDRVAVREQETVEVEVEQAAVRVAQARLRALRSSMSSSGTKLSGPSSGRRTTPSAQASARCAGRWRAHSSGQIASTS
jgi:hypothetical protein